ncbi:acyltransferase [Mycobacterium sp. E740]|uniref:acyltransferase family protein n=1 Tax=Mycobacterium sp. E740 TaxID=1834149 RepID=UPI0007FEC652|nr:acyltransferase [Mycobacterium sp. E740]OBI72182.1 hypothetical protein A5663_08340 [Mycobacterium sp. E740]
MTAPAKQRDASLDVARGIAIIAVVLAHVLRGLNAAHLLGDGAWIKIADQVILLFSLSVFAFVGGLFVSASVRKRGLGRYLSERESQFAFVWLTWTALQGGVLLLASGVVNTPGSIGSLLRIWLPIGQLWYLPFLMLVTLIFVPMWTWLPRGGLWVFGLAAVLSLGLWGFNTGLAGIRGFALAVFMVGGVVLGADRARALLNAIPVAVAAVAGVTLFAVGVVVVTVYPDVAPPTESHVRTLFTVALGVVLSLTLSVAVLFLGRAARSWSLLALCGRRSLEIYLAHIVLASGSRIILVKLGVHSSVLLIAGGLVAGVVGALIVAAGLRRVGLAWVFDGPKWLTQRRAPARLTAADSAPSAPIPSDRQQS